MSKDLIEPLGVFGLGPTEFQASVANLRASVGQVRTSERPVIANYLRSGAVLFALMEYTRDILDGAFEVPGGSGVLTDQSYYWRRDAAEYVEYYGIALPERFLVAGRSIDWVMSPIKPEVVVELDQWLYAKFRSSRGE